MASFPMTFSAAALLINPLPLCHPSWVPVLWGLQGGMLARCPQPGRGDSAGRAGPWPLFLHGPLESAKHVHHHSLTLVAVAVENFSAESTSQPSFNWLRGEGESY